MIDFEIPALAGTTGRWQGRRPLVALLAVNERLRAPKCPNGQIEARPELLVLAERSEP